MLAGRTLRRLLLLRFKLPLRLKLFCFLSVLFLLTPLAIDVRGADESDRWRLVPSSGCELLESRRPKVNSSCIGPLELRRSIKKLWPSGLVAAGLLGRVVRSAPCVSWSERLFGRWTDVEDCIRTEGL